MLKQSQGKCLKRSIPGLLLLSVLSVFSASAEAMTAYNLDFVFSPSTGAVPPMGTVTLTDLGTKVRFDIVNNAGAGSKLDSLYFNFAHGSTNPNQLTFSNVSAVSGTYQTQLAPTTGATISGLKADGDGYFDGKFAYQGNSFLGNGQTLSFELGATGQDLAESDFHFFSLPGGGSGSYILASHIQNLQPGGTSAWVGTVAAVPLPGAALLFLSGLSSFALLRKRNAS
ncbi:MAG TPA: hypothetical protein DDY39_17670 [Nitrospira sp.]|nr:hypothetical protein [Nitrospira sp.]HBR48922.1 hypothetical protein [Nitrospira sp.]